ncbi:MAG: membrane dipeptidase, partial [Terrimonas sp.]|nr:membrane dipeptidase [Terrimonas sp.]
HLSLASRRMLVEDIRNRPDFLPINQPLICTHAGFTGLSYKDIPDYMMDFKKERGKEYSYILWAKRKIYHTLNGLMTAFNPSSINLYDEDIMAIVRSGGMIGLNLDKRILGYTEGDSRPAAMNEFAFEEEYISNAEKDVYLSKRKIGTKVDDFNCITMQDVLEGGDVNPALADYHLCHFMSHVLHFIRVVQAAGDYDIQQALTQICIGSDFDGLINPVWCCMTVTEINTLKNNFRKRFMSYAQANKDMVKLPAGFDIEQFTEQLFFENGKDFIMRRLEMQ